MEYGDFVVRVRGAAAEWNVVQEPVKYGRGMDFDCPYAHMKPCPGDGFPDE
ncbi:hypothetical protein EES39_06120 [Streptomyces sp. ADI92-24]|nr:hypothetical protein EES39_06120 [Streptomyces sp. ADI92-24]